MNSLFGIPMTSILVVMLVLVGAIVLVLAGIGLVNRTSFRLGVRNIPRRRAQTALIVVGLMLSTLIITAAFGTGDTMTYSIKTAATKALGQTDETIVRGAALQGFAAGGAGSSEASYIPAKDYADLKSKLAGDDRIDGISARLSEGAPIVNQTTGDGKAGGEVVGFDADVDRVQGSFQTTTGKTVKLGELAPGETYLSDNAANILKAKAGDTVMFTAKGKLYTYKVRDLVVYQTGGSGDTVRMFVPLFEAQQAFGRTDLVTEILISNRGQDDAALALSDEVTRKVRSLLITDESATAAKTFLAQDSIQTKLKETIAKIPAGTKPYTKMESLQAGLNKPAVDEEFKSLLGDSDVQAQLASLAGNLDRQDGAKLGLLLVNLSSLTANATRQDLLDQGELLGSVFTSIFIVFGLFSIIAGIVLIFLIFVMLAAERKPEMGMARAIGAQRGHLVRSFLFEGMVYDFLAALLGVVLGLIVAAAMVGVMAQLFGQSGFALTPHFEPRSIIVSFCLGLIVTFATVVASAYRVSRLNIVAAIRDTDEIPGRDRRLVFVFLGPIRALRRGARSLRRGPIISRVPRALFHWTFGEAGALWGILVAFISRGPLLVVIGALLISLAYSTNQAAFFAIGVSLGAIAIGLILRWILASVGVRASIRDRLGYTISGLLLVVYWLAPFDTWQNLFHLPSFSAGIEMFVVSGVLAVTGAVWAVIYNSDLLLVALTAVFGRFGLIAPALKTAVAYPMASKFRTGMALFLFALIIFTMMVMSVLSESTSKLSGDSARVSAGFQILASANPNNVIPDISAAIAASPKLKASDFKAVASVQATAAQLREVNGKNQAWNAYPVQGVDNVWLDANRAALGSRAHGYASDADVWQAVKSNPNLAVIDEFAVPQKQGGGFVVGLPPFSLSTIYREDKEFDPVSVEIRDPVTAKSKTIQIIGVRSVVGDFNNTIGLYLSSSGLQQALSFPVPPARYFFALQPGVDVGQTVRNLNTTFLQNGLEAQSYAERVAQQNSTTTSLNNLLQGFMSLGLLVGIAALGVITARAVVERRQQIGMLRAIGFQKSMVGLSFLLESSFIALLGILLGVATGLLLGYNLVESIAKTTPNLTFEAPWLQIVAIVVIAYLFSLLTTILPARQASRIFPAEALRYE